MARKQSRYNYDDAFRAEAVALVIYQKLLLSADAKQVGVSFETLRKWISESWRKSEDEVDTPAMLTPHSGGC
jgi:transposase-like protein